jgi:hypothetical protein
MDNLVENAEVSSKPVENKKIIDEVASMTVKFNHLMAQLKLMKNEGDDKPSQIMFKQKNGAALPTLQVKALNMTNHEDEKAAKAIIDAQYQKHQTNKKIIKVENELQYQNQVLKDLQQTLHLDDVQVKYTSEKPRL